MVLDNNEIMKIMEKKQCDRETAWRILKNREEKNQSEKRQQAQKKPKDFNQNIDALIKSHYKAVKPIIMELSKEGDTWRAGNGDFSKWYKYEGDNVRLFDLTNSEDYDYLTSKHRSLHWTLNFFDNKLRNEMIPKSLHNEHGDKITIGSFADTRTYSLGVDIDSLDIITKKDIRDSVEKLAQYMADRFRETCPTSVYSCFSGGGVYIYIHQNLFTKKFEYDENADYSWRMLTGCFNTYIKDIENDFFKEYPECKGKVKADAINTKKRVFKTLFSVHKKYPFAVTPFDIENIKIDLQKSKLPLDPDIIKSGKNWMKKYNIDERTPLMERLKKYEDSIKTVDDDTKYEITVMAEKADKKDWPPCMLKIASMKRPNGTESISGATRMKTAIATFLGQAGYEKEEASTIFKAVSNQVGGPETNIFESWYKKMSCPTCETIKKKGSGFPHMDMGELELCQPDDYCKGIKHPIEYIEKIKKESATTFPFELDAKRYTIKFRKEKDKLIYDLRDNGEIGLETKVPMDFFQDDTQRKKFYNNICKVLDIEGKSQRTRLEKILDKNVLNKLQKTSSSHDKKKEKKQYQPKEQQMKILNEYREDQVIKKIQTDDKTRIVHTDKGIFLEHKKFRKDDGEWESWWEPERIYDGHIKPVVKMLIDDEFTVFKYKGDMEHVADIPTIIRSLKKSGGVLNKNRFDDCLNAIFLHLPKKTGHATFGVYEKNKKLELCLDVMPLRDIQKRINLRGKTAVIEELTKEKIEPYIETLKHWHSYEVLPSMGASGIAPLALMIRKKGKLVPILWNFSPVSHLGKSTVQKIFSLYLFSIFPVTGDAIDSKYRLSTVLDGVCGYQVIDEAERINYNQLEGIIKESPENYICNIRGTPDQGVIQYLSRAILGVNSNRFRINNETVLVRILKIEFDTSVVGNRAGNEIEVEKLTKTISELCPIGWRLIELYLDEIQHSMDVLLERISKHEKAFKKLYKNFIDPRRATAWATIYEGLKVWEIATKKFGIEWNAPSYEEYVIQVIDKIETTTRETGETPIDDFMHWWEMWKTLHMDRVRYDDSFVDTPKGIGVLWDEKTLEYKGEIHYGNVITGAILREYKKEKESKIDSLADIAKAITLHTGIPKIEILKGWRIGEKNKWCVFVPYDIDQPTRKEKRLDEYSNQEDGEDESTQSDDIQRIERYILDVSKDNEADEKAFVLFLKNVMCKKDPEKYLQELFDHGIITCYKKGKISFTG